MKELPRIPTPDMMAVAWDILRDKKENQGIAKLGPGIGVKEIYQAMYDAYVGEDKS